MGIRSRLKAAVRKRLSGQEVEPAPAMPASPVHTAAPEVERSAPPQAADVERPAPPPAPPPVVEAAPASAAPEISDEQAAKVAKHFEKTRRAVLKFVADQGGSASMAEMHDYSERRYFIAHKKFSDLMEGIVDEGLIDFDHAAGEATLTSAGQSYIAS